MNEQIKAHYLRLQIRVSDFFSQILNQHANKMKCAQGCYTCCAAGLAVSALEGDTIVDYLRTHPDKLKTITTLQSENPHEGKHCVFLSAQGHCQVYEARPLICRSHGAPVQYRYPGSEETFRDACPLNFEDLDINTFPVGEVLNMETVNTLLAMLNSQYDRARTQERLQMKDLIAMAQSPKT